MATETETDGETPVAGERDSLYYTVRNLPGVAKGTLLALPPFVYLSVFFLVPMVTILNFSIRTQENFQITSTFTADNLAYVLTIGTFAKALWFSVSTSVVVTAITLVLGLPVGYYIALRAPDSLRNVLLFLVIAPLWVNFYVRAFAVLQLTSTRGLINVVLVELGLVSSPIGWLSYSQPAVVIGLVYIWLPLMILPIYAMLREMDEEWLRAARDLGAGPLRIHYEVTLPTALPGIVLGSLFVFLLSLGNQSVSQLLGGSKGVTYPQAIVNQLAGSVNWPVAAAASAVMMAFVILVLLGVFAVLDMEEMF